MPDEPVVAANALGLQPPKGGKIEDSEEWRKYKQMFNLYIKATNLENEADDKKIAIFLKCAGDDILEIYNGMSGNSSLKWDELLIKYDDHFNNKTNTVVNSYRFYNLRQEQDEPVERFVMRLRNAAKTCNFLEESRMIRDMLVIGVREGSVKERMLKSATNIIVELIKMFSTHGIPRKIVSNNMPFGSFEFKKFAREHGIELVKSSPHYAQSNGLAEKAVGIVKNIMKKCKETGANFDLAMLHYRTTPFI